MTEKELRRERNKLASKSFDILAYATRSQTHMGEVSDTQ